MNFRGVMLCTLVKCALVKGFDFFSERELKLILEAALVCPYASKIINGRFPRGALIQGGVMFTMTPSKNTNKV
jgi:hypothetical protein